MGRHGLNPLFITILCSLWVGTGTTALARPSPVSPASFLSHTMSNPNFDQPAGESWAWHANYNLSYFINAYHAWQDPAWLDAGSQYYEYLVSRLQTGPDGYQGWIGPYIYDATQWADVHVADAILFNGLLRFAELVLQTPALEAAYGARARHYVALAEKHLIEKWDSRGTWYEDGPYGAYFSWNKYLNPGDFKRWHKRDHIRNSNLSLPFNKNGAMGIAALRLYRITGKAEYYEKAFKIFALHKSRMQLFDQHYVWNYWEPLVPWDVHVRINRTRHWVNVHPSRDYQAAEVAQIVEAYHSGLVYSEEDIRRITRTNLHVMWNQDLKNPEYQNANRAIWPTKLPNRNTAGTLWPALGYFDQTVRTLQGFGSTMRGQIDRAYHEKVVHRNPPGFDRLLTAQTPDFFDFPFSNARNLQMVFAFPAVGRPGDRIITGVKTLTSGTLDIGLYRPDGSARVAGIYHGRITGSTDGLGGMLMIRWNGKDAQSHPVPPGEYRIRWTLDEHDYREFPITLTWTPSAATRPSRPGTSTGR